MIDGYNKNRAKEPLLYLKSTSHSILKFSCRWLGIVPLRATLPKHLIRFIRFAIFVDKKKKTWASNIYVDILSSKLCFLGSSHTEPQEKKPIPNVTLELYKWLQKIYKGDHYGWLTLSELSHAHPVNHLSNRFVEIQKPHCNYLLRRLVSKMMSTHHSYKSIHRAWNRSNYLYAMPK